jgi:hypothetical protein
LGQALEGGRAISRTVRLPTGRRGWPRLSVAGWGRHNRFASMKSLISFRPRLSSSSDCV